MPRLLRPHEDGSTHHAAGSALRADPHPATATCARQLMNPHRDPLSYDLLELQPDRPAHACSRTPRLSTSSVPASNPSQPPTRHAEHSAPSPNRIEVCEQTPGDTRAATPTAIPG